MSACATTIGRYEGPEALEVSLVSRVEEPSLGAVVGAEELYRDLAGRLAAEGATFSDLTTERVFVRSIRRDLPVVLAARLKLLAEIGQVASAPPLVAVQQPPLDVPGGLELAATAVIPRRRAAGSVADVRTHADCACDGCQQSGARVVRLGAQTSLHTGMIFGVGSTAYEEALNMFQVAEGLLGQCRMGFPDVVRTWIYVRDIARDYDALNRARREFFGRCGIERRPASTGVQGVPFPDEHAFAMTLHALQTTAPPDVSVMSARTLNEAWSYGADFSRGLRVADVNKVALYISGTASIDEAGRTVHVGDVRAQADRMLHNIEALLAAQGAGFAHLVSAVAYVKHPADAAVLRTMFRDRGFSGFPCSILEAPLCRPELLCETEAIAMLSPGQSGA